MKETLFVLAEKVTVHAKQGLHGAAAKIRGIPNMTWQQKTALSLQVIIFLLPGGTIIILAGHGSLALARLAAKYVLRAAK